MQSIRALLRILVLLLAGFAVSSQAAGPARVYQADLDESRWQSVRGDNGCHLNHGIPRFGTALFSEGAEGVLSLSVFTERAPERASEAQVIASSPHWKAPGQTLIGEVSVYAAHSTLRFGHRLASATLAALEAGQRVRMRFPAWYDEGELSVVLSPVRFRPALREHLDCVARLRTGTIPGNEARRSQERPAAQPEPPPEQGTQSAEDRSGATGVTAAAAEAPAAGSEGTSLADDLLPMIGIGTAMADEGDGTANAETEPLRQAGVIVELPESDDTSIYFVYDSTRLDKVDMDRLNRMAAVIQENPQWPKVYLTGHTSRRGNPEYNRQLGLGRAQRVKQHLVEKGVDPARLEIRTRGEKQPAVGDDDEYARAMNRRVSISAGM